MHRSSAGLLIAAALTVCLPALASATDASVRPSLKVKATTDFEVNGKGDAPAWAKTEWTPLRLRKNATVQYETRFKLLHSPTGIYLLMDGEDKKLTATITSDHAFLWTEDVFEAFFWTDERHPIYFEYEISPLNKELPILVPNFDGQFMGWSPWMYVGERATRKAVHITGGKAESDAAIQRWQAEVFFPYTLFKPLANVPPKPGSTWRANFYRMDYDGGERTQWEWSPVGETFHDYQNFGTLTFE